MPPMLMQHDADPASAIKSKVGMNKKGEIPGFKLFGNRILVGVYERPEKTKSGIFLTDNQRKEDEHQGKAALVLMKGEAAFQSDKNFDFMGDNLEVGDWVMLFVSHGLKCYVNGQLCRIVRDQDLTMKIPSPDQVY
jgi:co-chaperonin GroES (HSP10)